MNLTVLLHHADDDGAVLIVDEMGRLARSGHLGSFTTISVHDDYSRNVDLWQALWHTGSNEPQTHELLSGLANQQIAKLRLVALITGSEEEPAKVLNEAMELLARASLTTVGMQTTTTEARIAVTARGAAKPSRIFFGAHPTRNVIAIPFDRFDDSTGAEPVTDVTSPAFAAHGAVEVGAVCGLWMPMDTAPMETIDSKGGDASELSVRFTQSRIRSLHAPTVSLYELFGERTGGSLPVPSGFEAETRLSDRESEALIDAVLAGEDALVYDVDEYSDPVYSQKRLLLLVAQGLQGALKEFPRTLRLVFTQEARTVIRLALERSIAPLGGLKVDDRLDGQPARGLGPDSTATRIFSGRSPFPGEMWQRIMDRVLTTIDGDASSDEIRERVFGDPRRLPVNLDDLLDGMAELPGVLPQLALGEENATLFGQARQSLASDEIGSFGRPSDEALLEEATRRWTEVLALVEADDADLHRLLTAATPFDWTSDLLTLRHAEGTDNRHRAKVVRLVSNSTALTSAVKAIVGYGPERILWVAPEDESTWRPPLRAVKSREHTTAPSNTRRGLLMGINSRLEEQRVAAARHVEDLNETLRVATTGEASFAVPAIVYVLMSIGLMGLFFGFLTSDLFSPVLEAIPDEVGSGNGYGIFLVLLFAGSLSLTNLGIGLGWLKRLLAFAIPTVITVSVMLALAGLIDLVPRGAAMVALHVAIGVALAIAWITTQRSTAEIRHRVARASTMAYAAFLVIILAVLASRGSWAFEFLGDDLELEARLSLIIAWVSWAMFGFPFAGIWILRVQKRIHLENVASRAQWAADQLDRAQEAEERFRLGMTQWNVTACSIAQVLRQPYGPLRPSEQSRISSGTQGIRRAQVATLALTPRGEDRLRNQLRSELVKPGWLKRQSEVRIRTFQELRAQRQNASVVDFLEQRPEMDPLVPTQGEIRATDEPRSPRLEFAVLGERGAFDEMVSAPIGDRNLLEILSPMLQDPALHRIEGTSSSVDSAASFLSQALPSATAPRLPLDEVHAIDGSRGIDDKLQQLLWWPESIEVLQRDGAPIVERTGNRLIVDSSGELRDSIQLLAVRVDVSEMFDYYQLTNVEVAAEDVQEPISGAAESGPQIFG